MENLVMHMKEVCQVHSAHPVAYCCFSVGAAVPIHFSKPKDMGFAKGSAGTSFFFFNQQLEDSRQTSLTTQVSELVV